MIKTHPNSRFVLRDLEGIRDSGDVVLQISKTESTFAGTNRAVHLCEIVSARDYDSTPIAERLTAELLRVNDENRRLRTKITRLESALRRAAEGSNG